MKKAVRTKAKIRKGSENNFYTNTEKAVIGSITMEIVIVLLLAVFNHVNLPQVRKTTIVSPMSIHAISRKQATGPANTSPVTTISQKATPSTIVKLPPFIYTIRAGDNLAKIGTTFCDDPRAYLYLMEINNFEGGYSLQPGDQITVSCE